MRKVAVGQLWPVCRDISDYCEQNHMRTYVCTLCEQDNCSATVACLDYCVIWSFSIAMLCYLHRYPRIWV